MSHAPSEFPPPVDSQAEFVKRGLDPEDELIEVGVAIVGGGTAGLSAANRCWKRARAATEITSLPWFLKFGGVGILIFVLALGSR